MRKYGFIVTLGVVLTACSFDVSKSSNDTDTPLLNVGFQKSEPPIAYDLDEITFTVEELESFPDEIDISTYELLDEKSKKFGNSELVDEYANIFEDIKDDFNLLEDIYQGNNEEESDRFLKSFGLEYNGDINEAQNVALYSLVMRELSYDFTEGFNLMISSDELVLLNSSGQKSDSFRLELGKILEDPYFVDGNDEFVLLGYGLLHQLIDIDSDYSYFTYMHFNYYLSEYDKSLVFNNVVYQINEYESNGETLEMYDHVR